MSQVLTPNIIYIYYLYQHNITLKINLTYIKMTAKNMGYMEYHYEVLKCTKKYAMYDKCITTEGNCCTDKNVKVNEFNKYFTNTGQNLNAKLFQTVHGLHIILYKLLKGIRR